MVEDDTQDILILLERYDDYICHLLLRDAHISGSYFVNFSSRYIYSKRNMYIDYVVNKSTKVYMRIVWESGFSQQLLELVLKDGSGFIYEKV